LICSECCSFKFNSDFVQFSSHILGYQSYLSTSNRHKCISRIIKIVWVWSH
jgi:hypothetical protein